MERIRFINIIRVIGLFLVLTYHFFREKLPGGFFGVDVFFTFSGYLITSLIIIELENKGDFKFFPYIKRRFSRIFPVLFFSIFFTLPFIKLISPDFTANIDKQVAAALGFVTNYFEIIKGGTYESQLLPHLYIHTWSLSLEFQYYLIWGIFCTFLLFITSKFENNLKAFKIALLSSSIFFTVISYIHMQSIVSTFSEKSVAYFATTSHLYPFFVGSILGILFGLKIPNKLSEKLKIYNIKNYVISLFVISLVFLVILCLRIDFESNFAYKYGFFIASVLTAILILLTRMLHEILPKKYKEPTLIRHLADISYPMYLFHWPFFIIFLNLFTSKTSVVLITFLVSYILSNLVFYNIEPLFYKSSYKRKKNVNEIRKKMTATTVIFVSAFSVFASFNVFYNKKEISTLESEQMVGNIVQDIDKIEGVKIGIDNINEEPFLEKNGIYGFEKLKIDSPNKQFVSIKSNLSENLNSSIDSNDIREGESSGSLNSVNKVLDKEKQETRVEQAINNESISKNRIHSNVTIIGDSVALGARKKLLECIPNSSIDTKGSRSLSMGYSLLMDLQNSDNLGEYVVIALGTNGCNDANLYIDKIINEINPGHRLIFVTPFDGHWNESWKSYKTMQYLRDIGNKYPYVTIADWAAEISKQPQLLGSDKTHIGGNNTAIDMFANIILDAINKASSKQTK